MPSTGQNVIILMESSEDGWNISSKGGGMCLNRFCIEEDAAFECSGVFDLFESSREMALKSNFTSLYIEPKTKAKGKGYFCSDTI